MHIITIQLPASAARTGRMCSIALCFASYIVGHDISWMTAPEKVRQGIPLQKLQATTFGPEFVDWRMLFPGIVAARLRCAACNSEAGRMGGNVGADIGAGVGGTVSFIGSVTI